MTEVWSSGDAYEPYVGRWSRRVAVDLLDWLSPDPGLRWLDVGCGTGALASAVLDRCAPSAVTGIDASAGYVAWCRQRITDPRAGFEVGDAADLPAESADVVVSGLVLNFLPDPAAAVRSMRAAAPRGTVAAYVWDYAEGIELMRRFWAAAAAVDPDATALDEGTRFPLCHPDRLAELWRAAGLVGVETRSIEIDTVFADFDDYWQPFLGGQGAAPAYAMRLDEELRGRIRDDLRASLPAAPDGSIALTARAYAVRGRAGSSPAVAAG